MEPRLKENMGDHVVFVAAAWIWNSLKNI